MYRLPRCTCIPVRFCSKNCDKNKDAKGNQAITELPEAPTTCCMSGCANCVWLDYAEKLSQYLRDGGEQAIKEIDEKVTDPNIKAFIMQELRMRTKT